MRNLNEPEITEVGINVIMRQIGDPNEGSPGFRIVFCPPAGTAGDERAKIKEFEHIPLAWDHAEFAGLPISVRIGSKHHHVNPICSRWAFTFASRLVTRPASSGIG